MGLLRPDLGPVLAGEGGERGQVRLGVDQHLGDSEGKASLKASMTCLYWAMTACLLVGAKMVETSALTGLERAEPSLKVMLRVKRGAAALPGGPGQDRPDGGPDAGVRITGDQDHALGVVGRGDLEAALSQGPQDKDVQKSVVSASPRAMPRISRRPSADTPVATTSAWQTTLRPTLTSRWVAPGEQVGEPGVIQAAGQELVHALVDVLADP